VAQLFMTQLRQVEVLVQTSEQRALARLGGRGRPRRGSTGGASRRKPKASSAAARAADPATPPGSFNPRRPARKSS
jgi:hypothetical protein